MLKQHEKRILRRDILIVRRGSQCEQCGILYNGKNAGIFDFHHTNPLLKKFGVSLANMNRKLATLEEEADKCILLCCLCHRLIHINEI